MSVRKKPAKAVEAFLHRLRKDKEQILQVLADKEEEARKMSSMLKDIESTLKHTASSVTRTKRWEKEVMEQFCKLEQFFHDDIFTLNLKDPQVLQKLEQFKTLLSTADVDMLPQNNPAAEASGHESGGPRSDKDIEVVSNEDVDKIKEKLTKIDKDDRKLMKCVLCLSVFPEDEPIKKRPLIYWWMGEGLVTDEEDGEKVFRQLHNKGLGFIRISATNSLTLCPGVRPALQSFPQEEGKRRNFLPPVKEGVENVQTVFNISKKYLGISADWLRKLQNLEVLQLGRWQDLPKHHIEAEKSEPQLLSGLGSQKNLKYLSLRGISGIEALPPTIRKLAGLQILDLRACHNLEKLPDTISDLRELTHLDVSECYLLESIPRRLQHLTKLQAIKGFVVDNTRKGSCKIRDLARLTQLRKLSIRVRSDSEQLGSLVNLLALRILTISWMKETATDEVQLPEHLTKLNLWSVPFKAMPGWLHPTKLPKLKNLRIKGGKLEHLMNQNHDTDQEYLSVEFVRLQYLTGLAINQEELVNIFPNYLYLEKTKCGDHPNIILSRRSVPHGQTTGLE